MLSSYDAWGEDRLQRFIGMFAFTLYNVRRKQLFLARDRAGERLFF